MTESILVLCDVEEEYAHLMTEFLREHHELPWQIHTYTSVEKMISEEQKGEIALLVVSEAAYTEEITKMQPEQTVILNESGVLRWDHIRNINKYQQADNVLRELLEVYLENAKDELPYLHKPGKTKFVGVFSPIRRCLQTSYALTMAQMLALEHRTLYLNFESYVGIREIIPDAQTRDLADLLYFLAAKPEKFKLRMQSMLRHMDCLDYIPPMKAGVNLLSVKETEWLRLLQKIRDMDEYEYVILDLSESIQGLFEILRYCCQVYTLVREDQFSKCKLTQYEHILQLYEYEDILEKSKKLILPRFRKIPEDLTQFTKGELADFTRRQLEQLL